MQGIHAVKDLFLLAFHPAGNQHLAVQLLLTVAGGEAAQFFDEDAAFAGGDELAGIDGVHQQLEFRQLKGGVLHIIPAAPAALLHNLKGGIGHLVDGLDVVINALALGVNAALLEQFHHAGHTQRVGFVGFPGQNFQQGQQF